MRFVGGRREGISVVVVVVVPRGIITGFTVAPESMDPYLVKVRMRRWW
jgi:hypothetical protein